MKALMLLCALSSLAMGQHDYEDGWAIMDWYVSTYALYFQFDVSAAPNSEDKIFYIFLEYPGQEDVYQILAVTQNSYRRGHDQYGTGTLGQGGSLEHDADSTSSPGENNLTWTSFSSDTIKFFIPRNSGDPYDFPIEYGATYNIRCGYSDYDHPQGWSGLLLADSWTTEGTIVVPYPYSLTPTTWGSIKTSF